MKAVRRSVAVVAAIGMLLAFTVPASAHPLGNFTINHYSRLMVGGSSIALRWVLDMAEIPAFTERRRIDTDGDGTVQEVEAAAYLDATLPNLIDGLVLELDGHRVIWTVTSRELSFPQGQGGLSTMRMVVDLAAERGPATGSGTYRDTTFEALIGWREVVVRSVGAVRLVASDAPATDVSGELLQYPASALASPLDVRSATFSYAPASAAETRSAGPAEASPVAGGRPNDPLAALVGGGLTFPGAALAMLLAIALGAIHGISPGHGKTLVAAYLIGSRGTLRQAIWLGLTVAITHTAGVFVLGLAALVATELVVPERVIVWLSLASSLLVVGLGATLLWRVARHRRDGHRHDHPHPHAHPHGHDAATPPLSRGAIAALGLVGGLVPSASALLVLLAAIAFDRLAFGLLLVVAFGIGMALVLTGVSASVVLLHRRLESSDPWLLQHRLVARLAWAVPLASALLVLAFGVVLTAQAAAALG
jgi:nickel/cobalt exporter